MSDFKNITFAREDLLPWYSLKEQRGETTVTAVSVRIDRDVLALFGLGTVIELLLVLLDALTGLDRTLPSLEALYTLPFAAFTLAVLYVIRTKPRTHGLYIALVLLIFASLFRFTFLLQAPTLSGDIYRYYWDGKLLNNGISPYSYAPYADQLTQLRDGYWNLVQDKDIISPYPPLMEMVNALVYAISPTILAYKAAFFFFDMLSIVVLLLVLSKLNLDLRLGLMYAWNPLFVLEFGSSGHNDPLSVLLVLTSFYFLLQKRSVSSAGAMALAVVSKLFPLLIAPLFLRRWGIKGTAVFASLIAVSYVPFLAYGKNVYDAISTFLFSDRPFFNGGAFSLLQSSLQSFGASDPVYLSRLIVYGVFLTAMAYFLMKAFRGNEDTLTLARYSAALITLYLALSATVQPWYLAWVFPFIAVFSSWAWFAFSWTIFLTYYTYTQVPIQPGYWGEILWVRLAEYIPLYFMAILEIVRGAYLKPRKEVTAKAS